MISSRRLPNFLPCRIPPTDRAEAQDEQRRFPTLAEAVTPLFALLLFAIASSLMGFRLEWTLLASAMIAGLVAARLGYTVIEMLAGIISAVSTAAPAMLIMLAIGILIAAWISAGVIPMLIFYGLQITSARFFLLTASLLCSAISLCTGTSWGTMGTIGVALMSIARVLGIPLPSAAGAIISGAYFGDKLSPMSDQTNLAPAIVGVRVAHHIRWLLWTTGPAWLVSLAVYFIAGIATPTTARPDMTGLAVVLHASFHFSPFLVVPPLIMLWFVAANRSAVFGMLLSSAVAGVLAIVIQGQSPVTLLDALLTGYKPATSDTELNALLARGGFLYMGRVMVLLLAAFSFAGIMIRCRLLARLLNAIVGETCGVFKLIASTIVGGILTGLVTGSSHLSIIVPGQLFADAYRNANLAAKNLSRTTEDSGTVIVPLIPWSAAGVFAAKTLGVATLQYLPWAVMNYTGFLFALLYAGTGIGLARRTSRA